jgi:DNA helicase-2/ATP-dependent DNA helicase PcrA
MNYLDELNAPQRRAAEVLTGPLLIIAGAGAGKTKTITYRIGNLINHGVEPSTILAITFTNKAAREMKDRISRLLATEQTDRDAGEPWVGTFHALGVTILRAHAARLGLNRYFSILDRDDSLAIIKQCLKELSIEDKRFEPRKVLGAISREKGRGLLVTDYRGSESKDFYPRIIATLWQKYEKKLAERKALDFDDLLLKTVLLLKKFPDILAHYHARWQYLHIDEYQDTNDIQYELTSLLTTANHNICVVGDMDQSIYGWRGADFTNLLSFEKDYPEAEVVLLEENYRSTQTILAAANEVIKKNKNRHEKNLFTQREAGEKIVMATGLDENEEARLVAEKIRGLLTDGYSPSEIAILYRANFQSRVLEQACLQADIPYLVLGTRFFERREVKDIIGYIKAAQNPDDIESVKRVINLPARGIGPATLAKIFSNQENELSPKMQEKIRDFRSLLTEIREKSKTDKPSELVKFVMWRTGLEVELKGGGEDDLERLENLREFVTLATKYDEGDHEEGLLGLISEAALASDQDDLLRDEGGVRLMTVHASKGLEFKCVFVTGLEQDLFPHTKIGSEERDEEEERRLFYVAITRAGERLFLTYAQSRTIFGSRQVNLPSEFLFDISEDLLTGETRETRAPGYLGEPTGYIDF